MQTNELLQGNIKKQLMALSAPMLAGNILQQCYNAADSLIVGRFLGTEAFGAVGIAGSIMNLFVFVLGGFSIGVSVIFAQMYGGGNREGFRREVFTAVTAGGLLTLLLTLSSLFFLPSVLRGIHTPEELENYVRDYLHIILSGLLITYYNNLFSNLLQATGDTKTPLCFLFLSTCINLILDYMFIAVFSLGIRGAAGATVIAQAISMAGCGLYIKMQHGELLWRRADVGIHRGLLKRTFGLGLVSALQASSLYIGKILVQSTVNTLGTPGIAAYTATMRLEGLANSFGDSGCQGVSIFVSQNYGNGNERRVRQGVRQGLFLHVALGFVISCLMYLAAEPGIRLFLGNGSSPALEYGRDYIRVISLFYLLCFIGSNFVGYFKGVGRVVIPFIGTTCNITVRVIASHSLVPRWGVAGVAWATALGWFAVVGFLTTMYVTVVRGKGRTAS